MFVQGTFLSVRVRVRVRVRVHVRVHVCVHVRVLVDERARMYACVRHSCW